jgi:hypothetical protein
VAGQPGRFLCAIAHRRGTAAPAPTPRTQPQHAPRRNVPWVTRSANWPSRPSCTRCADRWMKGHCSPGPEHRALSGLAPRASRALPSVASLASQAQTLDPGASTSPAGLTARARPEARPEGRAANLHSRTKRGGGAIIDAAPTHVPILVAD